MNNEDMKEALDLLRMSWRYVTNPTLQKSIDKFLLKFPEDKSDE